MADEHGAQQACNKTSLTPSGTTIAGFFIIVTHFGCKDNHFSLFEC
jgi:hypothetical protein